MVKIQIKRDSTIPIYIQLRDSLVATIKQKQLQPLTQLPNVAEIAEAAGVSIRTADLALQELVRDGICFRRPKKGTFVGKESDFSKYSVCGVWTNFNLSLPHAYPMPYLFYSGITETAKEIGAGAVIVPSDPKELIQRYDRSQEFDFLGIITLDFDKFDSLLVLAKEFPQKKFFYLNYFTDKFNSLPSNMYAIINDDFAGAYRLVEHFISQQAERFLILSQKLPLGDYTYKERIRGFRSAIEDYSVFLSADDILEVECSENHFQQAEYAFFIMKKFLRLGRIPDVILCTNDSLALGVLRAVRSEKRTDIRVAGYDGMLQDCFSDMHFTTTQVAFPEMARQAFLLMNNKLEAHGNVIKLSPKLQIINTKEVVYA